MRFVPFVFALLLCFYGCAKKISSNSISAENTVFEEAYYQDLQKNIIRLHHLFQGTFTAYDGDITDKITSWKVSEGDSVILYTVPLGDVYKDGYWTYSYEFMTSLPNAPIYTSIKSLKQISRDTIDVFYYETKEPVDVQLIDLLELNRLNAKIKLDNLVQRKKRVRYVRASASHFIGKSLVYEDPDRHCLRQNGYDISPQFYQVKTTFYDKETHDILHIKKRPNLMVRRSIESKFLQDLVRKH